MPVSEVSTVSSLSQNRWLLEGDMGVCRVTVLDNFSCRISVILNSKCGLLRYSPDLRDAGFLRGILDGI